MGDFLGGGAAKAQAKRAEEEAAKLRQERDRADAEAQRIQAENQRSADARKRALLGRSSLINTSELGVQENLG